MSDLTDTSATGEHEYKETLTVDVFYPEHVQRTESALFRETKHTLIDKDDKPCMVCGSRENREVHHWFVEWAYANSIDWKKMQAYFTDFDWSSFKEPSDFVDSEYNCRVLCMTHHRAKDAGIHMIPYPIWLEQLHKTRAFVFSPTGAPTGAPTGTAATTPTEEFTNA